jgi:hypothetical protein
VIAVVDAFAFGGIKDIPGSPKERGAEAEEGGQRQRRGAEAEEGGRGRGGGRRSAGLFVDDAGDTTRTRSWMIVHSRRWTSMTIAAR